MDEACYHVTSYCKYLVQYNVVWRLDAGFFVLEDGLCDALRQVLKEICNEYSYDIKALDVTSDYVRIFVDVPHTVAPCDIARTLKSLSTVKLLKVFPGLRQFYARHGTLWPKGYLISSDVCVNGPEAAGFIGDII